VPRPADRAGTIKTLQLAGQNVAMVGEGVYDAPALATATIGIGIPIAAFGWLNPMIAGAAMALSSLSVIVNSSLLRCFPAA
jgi:Cu+-exporting ATPase